MGSIDPGGRKKISVASPRSRRFVAFNFRAIMSLSMNVIPLVRRNETLEKEYSIRWKFRPSFYIDFFFGRKTKREIVDTLHRGDHTQ